MLCRIDPSDQIQALADDLPPQLLQRVITMSTATTGSLISRSSSLPIPTTFALAGALVLLVPDVLSAAAIAIDDTSPAEVVVITFSDFEGGFSVNGSALATSGSITLPETDPLTFIGHWIATPDLPPLSRTIYLIEPTPSAAPLVSDIFTYNIDTNPNGLSTIQGSFVSDVNDNLGVLPREVNPADVFIEDGLPVLFSAPFLTGRLISDVPEPSTLVLFGFGVVSLVGFRLRNRSV